MTSRVVSIQQMKAIEARADQLGVSYLQLMENAGTACARRFAESSSRVSRRSAVILCGGGNNGGDGLVIARLLAGWQAEVTVILVQGTPATEIARSMYQRLLETPGVQILDAARETGVSLFQLRQADVIFDCIFGTEFHGEITGVPAQMIEAANQTQAVRIAVDIPSGISGDTGACSAVTFHADQTFALAALKKAHSLPASRPFCGEISCLEIGIPREAFSEVTSSTSIPVAFSDLAALLPARDPQANKGNFGKLLLIAGRAGMGGAAMMATLAALRCGCGLTTLASAQSTVTACFPHLMEAMTLPLEETDDGAVSARNIPLLIQRLHQSTACVVGCGLGTGSSVTELVTALIQESTIPLVLDADGINALSGDINIVQTAKAPVILTPHPKEFSRICGKSVAQIEADREEAASSFARAYSVILVLKGHETLTALPDGTLYRNTTGNAAMAKGGSGDVLAGMIGSFLAQGFAPDCAARLAVCLHGAAGEDCAARLSEYSVLARDLIDALPVLLRRIEQMRDA